MFGKEIGSESGDRDRVAMVADLRRRLDRIGVGATWATGLAGNGDVAPGGIGGGGRAAPAPGLLTAPAPLAGALPRGGISHGSVVSLTSAAPGHGGVTSVLLSLLAAPPGIWAAVVGMPGIGVLAAAELGVDLSRLALIPDPGSDVLQVLSVLADGVDVIATVAPRALPPSRQRVLTGRLRERGVVLLVTGRWPGADLTITVTQVRWSGIEQGHGRLRDREIDVQVGGRRAGGGMGATLLLRAGQGAVTVEAAPTATQRNARQEPVFASAETG